MVQVTSTGTLGSAPRETENVGSSGAAAEVTEPVSSRRDGDRDGAWQPPPAAASWAGRLTGTRGTAGAREIAVRALTGVGLTTLFGLALGAREGGLSLLQHAVGVPAAVTVVACFGVPALYIVLSMFEAPVRGHSLADAASRALGRTGVALAGLAPAAALFMVTSASDEAARWVAVIGLVLGGGVGLRGFLRELKEAVVEADSATRLASLGIAGAGTCTRRRSAR